MAEEQGSISESLSENVYNRFDPAPIAGNYPQSASSIFEYDFYSGEYMGGSLGFGNGTKLTVPKGALKPPPGTPVGASIEISGLIDFDVPNRELFLEFGPSGCQFDPCITLRIKYSDLGGSGIPTLYYIDKNGNYLPQRPDEISTTEKWMKLYIDHFSRYAVSFSQ
jgi:hypothetical protein